MTPGNAAMKAARLPATDVDLLVVGGGLPACLLPWRRVWASQFWSVMRARWGWGFHRNGGICSGNIGMTMAILKNITGAALLTGYMLKG